MHYFSKYYKYRDAYFNYKGFGFRKHTLYLNQYGLTLDLTNDRLYNLHLNSYIDTEYCAQNKEKLVSMLDDINLNIFKLIEEISKQVSANNFSFGEKGHR